ncbi:hypothetical protein [Stetteria hydrogenophila]
MPVSGSVEKEGLCPRCGGPAVYHYTVEAPVEHDGVQAARFSYSVSCLACGFRESKKVYIPLSAAYMLRYIIDPSLRGVIERAKLVADLKSAGVHASREGARA